MLGTQVTTRQRKQQQVYYKANTMEHSESIKNIGKAIGLFQMKVDKIVKDAKNPFFKSSYATLSNILDAIAMPMQECGLAFSQHPEGDNLVTMLMHHPSGEYFKSSYRLNPVKNDPQAVGSSVTYARRYSLVAILGLNVDDDDDGNAATRPQKSNRQAPAPKKTQPSSGIGSKPALTQDQYQAALNGTNIQIDNVIAQFKLTPEQLQKLNKAKIDNNDFIESLHGE